MEELHCNRLPKINLLHICLCLHINVGVTRGDLEIVVFKLVLKSVQLKILSLLNQMKGNACFSPNQIRSLKVLCGISIYSNFNTGPQNKNE